MSSVSYTQRTLEALRDQKVLYGVVERFLARVGPHGVRQDFLGCIDIIAVYPDRTVGIQSTGPNGHSAHRIKIAQEPRALQWVSEDARRSIELWSWELRPREPGSRQEMWIPRIEVITPEIIRAVLKKHPRVLAPRKDPGVPLYCPP